MNDRDLRRDARRRGLGWGDVLSVYRQIKEEERAVRERPNELRETAWVCHWANMPGRWPFWRHGFAKCYGPRMARGEDLTSIRGYDTLAQELSWEFPEAADAEELWAFLLSPYNRMPTREEMLRRAIDRAEIMEFAGAGTVAAFPDEDF